MMRGMWSMVMVVGLSGCGLVSPDMPQAAAGAGAGPGWRKGLVVQTGDRDSLGPSTDSDCRATAHESTASQRYVEVRYFVGRHAHLRIVPIDDASTIAAGDAVWFRSFGCASARTLAPSSG